MRKKTGKAGRLRVIAGLAVLLAACAASAGEPVQRSGEASARGTVRIENMVGSVEVIGWDRNEVSLEGTLGKDVEDLEFKTGKKKSVIKVIYPHHARNINDGADLVIRVPQGSRVSVQGVSADIKIAGIEGRVQASSVSGDIEVSGAAEILEAESISGDVTVDSGSPKMELESISGMIRVRGKTAEIDVETVSGDIELELDRYLELSAESVSGSMKVSGDLHPEGDFSFDCVSGSITLTVPGDVAADFEVSTFSGSIDNGFGQKSRKTSRYAPGRELEFQNGDGGAEVKINSFSGDVRIRKK